MISPFLWCHFKRSEDILLCCNAIVGSSCHHFGNAVNMKVGIHITMSCSCSHLYYHCKYRYLVLYVLNLVKLNVQYFLFIAPSYLQGALPKRLWKTSFFRKRLRIDQETLQVSVFASMFLSLVKKTVSHFLVTVLS